MIKLLHTRLDRGYLVNSQGIVVDANMMVKSDLRHRATLFAYYDAPRRTVAKEVVEVQVLAPGAAVKLIFP